MAAMVVGGWFAVVAQNPAGKKWTQRWMANPLEDASAGRERESFQSEEVERP